MTTLRSVENVLTITQLNQMIKRLIESDGRLNRCVVTGEISNFKHHSSGHMYLTLKDDKSRVRAIMFAGKNRYLTFEPKDGMRVMATGSIGVFERDGQYQLYIDDLQPDGIGALYVAFTQLRDRLDAEGLFATERKRKLPKYPRKIGVVTSATGAVIRDISSTLRRRYPMATIVLAPVLVQGVSAAATIAEGIRKLNDLARDEPIDVIIIARGGGSLEELWPFNEEVVARAIANSSLPVVSAVGHETDFTISDFVADVRAATPTAAAELVAPMCTDLVDQLGEWEIRIRAGMERLVVDSRQRLRSVEQAKVLQDPTQYINLQRQTIDYLHSQLRQHVSKPLIYGNKRLNVASERLYRVDLLHRIDLNRHQIQRLKHALTQEMQKQLHRREREFERAIVSLEALNPLSVLARGYSLVYKEDGQTVVNSVKALSERERIHIHMSDGMVKARIIAEEESSDESAIQSRLNI